MVERISSQDTGYAVGDLSLYPSVLDDKYQLYKATNNSVTKLKQSLTYSGKHIIVEDNSTFPENGIIRIGPPPGESGAAEMVYYDSKANSLFKNLIRGFAGSRQNQWPAGSFVANAVFSEHHNATKDAIINIQNNLGTENVPVSTSLNGILKKQEVKFLAPKAVFRAFPIKGPPSLQVRFQNFSTGPVVRSFWDFGDGTTSTDFSPFHTYSQEGVYTVQLNVITTLGAQGYTIKSNYITVDKESRQPFFYVTPLVGVSKKTADANTGHPTLGTATTFKFVDQTDGNISQRWWILDGEGKINEVAIANQTYIQEDPNIHTLDLVYDTPGEYNPALLVLLDNQTIKKAYVNPSKSTGQGIIVL